MIELSQYEIEILTHLMEKEFLEYMQLLKNKKEEIENMKIKIIKSDLDFLDTYIGVALGIQTLEHYDKNYLSGNNCTQSEAMLEHLNLAKNKIKDIKNKLNTL